MWHRIFAGCVAESTEQDPHGRFHPDLLWVPDAGAGAGVGWLYADGVFSPPPPPTVAAQSAALLQAVNGVYQNRMAAIADGYPLHERESWPVQLEEAKALQADPEATTPWLDACAGARGLDKAELATRVLAKDAAYRLISGTLSGIRQRHEDAIAQLQTVEDANSYDVQAWWPSEEGEPQQ